MIVDKKYCASSFLMYRTIADRNKIFADGIIPYYGAMPENRVPVHNSEELYETLKLKISKICKNKKAAICLSGGIDSAILAKFMPEGSIAYTFKCVVPGVQVIDETQRASLYAKECNLQHRVIEIYWDDFNKYVPKLMLHKGAPIHSIEVQIYKAAQQAKNDGFDTLIFGESADCLYGGLSNILSKDWTFGEFVDRYSFVKPYYVLKESELVLEPYKKYCKDGYIDVHDFYSNAFFNESVNSYLNACKLANVEFFSPYAETILAEPLDLSRIRSGENKYLVREVFNRLYKEFDIPPKTPMPRPMNEWLKEWKGPSRPEFIPNCVDNMTGDQKWLVWALEKYFNLIFAEK